MVIDFSQGKLIVTEHEVQLRLNVANVVLQSQAEDISLRHSPPMLIANGGSVRWSLKLDNEIQLHTLAEILGVEVQ
ncbi:DUF3389 domain-containing protein [Shewanella acanthi]|uniref:DUF3389 domain-containing protein n=1 Tax=Shewanella acanthi TaxID=2864212 RepID=UPI001C65C45C|nr:DUF3389 domain-containing protein [Shewanella acanthi]QYJ77547.1 DUF3389 domain-containing protein [Shewanella acanthi]